MNSVVCASAYAYYFSFTYYFMGKADSRCAKMSR